MNNLILKLSEDGISLMRQGSFSLHPILFKYCMGFFLVGHALKEFWLSRVTIWVRKGSKGLLIMPGNSTIPGTLQEKSIPHYNV